MTISFQQSKLALLLTFLGFLLINLIALSGFSVDAGHLGNLFLKVGGIYAVHLSIIFGGFFSTAQGKKKPVNNGLFITMMALSVFWNLLITLFVMRLNYGNVLLQTAIEDLDAIGSFFNFLVAGGLTFFFVRS